MNRNVSYLIVLLFFLSCTENRLDVNVSEINVELKLNRFEQELFEADKYKLKELNQEWIKTYGILYESFVGQMINEGSVEDPLIATRLEFFLNDSTMQACYQETQKVFANFDSYYSDFKQAFKHYKYYFPKKNIPQITTFYSNFNAKAFPTKTNLGIGLDLFLGKDNELVNQLPPEIFPAYFKEKMEPKYLVTESLKHWLYFNFSSVNDFANFSVYTIKEDFLNTIIFHGKMLYALEALTPNEQPEIKFGYTNKQLDWCEQNEKYIYQTLVEKKLMYSKDPKDIVRFINDGPFTSGLSNESPAMIGVYMGYQMVKQYMDKNPNVSLSQLLEQTNNSRKILSGYKI